MNSDDLATILGNDSIDPYGIELYRLAGLLISFQSAKEADYGESWAKRGEIGVYMNLMRKVDRLEMLVPLALSGECDGMVLVDTLVDMTLYGMMWLSYIAAARPNDIECWIRNIYCRETGASEEEVLMILFGVGE